MPKFGERSQNNLDTCHQELQRLAHSVIHHYDFAVIEGARSDERQAQLYAEGKSTLDGVNRKSRHQTYPSEAMDVMPWPADLHGKNIWQDAQRWAHFIGIIRGRAEALGISIRVGFDWDGDGSPADHRFVDCPHIELKD